MQPPVKKWNEDSVEAKAYKAVEEVPTRENNDRNRLGYYVYLYLDGQYDTLKEAIRISQTRLLIDEEKATNMVRLKLNELGFEIKE